MSPRSPARLPPRPPPAARRSCARTRAPWLAAIEKELLTFPGDKHDDLADSVSQYLTWVQRNLIQPRGAVKMTGMGRAKRG